MKSEMRDLTKAIPQNGDGHSFCLDVGGGQAPFRRVVEQKGYHYINLDIAGREAEDIQGDAHALPLRDGVFDLALSVQSLEHFKRPEVVLHEIRRVLKMGGKLLILVPFLHGFHLTDYWRYTPLGLKVLLDGAGFTIERLEASGGLLTVVGVSIGGLLHRIRLKHLARLIRWMLGQLDRMMAGMGVKSESLAHNYLVVARVR